MLWRFYLFLNTLAELWLRFHIFNQGVPETGWRIIRWNGVNFCLFLVLFDDHPWCHPQTSESICQLCTHMGFGTRGNSVASSELWTQKCLKLIPCGWNGRNPENCGKRRIANFVCIVTLYNSAPPPPAGFRLADFPEWIVQFIPWTRGWTDGTKHGTTSSLSISHKLCKIIITSTTSMCGTAFSTCSSKQSFRAGIRIIKRECRGRIGGLGMRAVILWCVERLEGEGASMK